MSTLLTVFGTEDSSFIERLLIAFYESLGIPYYYGKGSASTPFPSDGYDCSGFVLSLGSHVGLISSSYGDYSAAGLRSKVQAVDEVDLRIGDLVFYADSAGNVCHVTYYVGNINGVRYIIGANSGNSQTHGDDSNARVKLQGNYWLSALHSYGRF